MRLSGKLQNEIIELLSALPNMHDSDGQQTFIVQTALDPNLEALIQVGKPPKQFFSLLVPVLVKYGKLDNGKYAIESALEAAKTYTGQDGKTKCEKLINKIRDCANKEKWEYPKFSRYKKILIGVVGVGIIFIAIFLLPKLVRFFSNDADISPLSLVELTGIEFVVDDWNPRLVDLRKMAHEGLPVKSGQRLRLSEIFLNVPESYKNDPQYQLRVEVYILGTDTIIGEIDAGYLNSGQISIGKVSIKKDFQYTGDDKSSVSWLIQDHWKGLLLAFIAIPDKGEPIVFLQRKIPFIPGSTAWIKDLPDVNLIAIRYAVNDKYPVMANLSEATIQVNPGDTLAIYNVWYNMYEQIDSSVRVYVEAFLNPGEGFNDETHRTITDSSIETGIHVINIDSPEPWIIDENVKDLILTLARNDGVIMDRVRLHLDPQGSSGYFSQEIPSPTLVSMNFELYDFNPHIIDVRTFSENGVSIPVAINHALQFKDLWVSMPTLEKSSYEGYSLKAEVHLGKNLIGIPNQNLSLRKSCR